MPRGSQGFSLLEVILALAILTAAVVIVSELVRLGARNADRAEALLMAQSLCESKLAELVAGDQLPDSTSGVPFSGEVPDADEWTYGISVEALSEANLYRVEVTVTRDEPGPSPVQFTLVRWMIDPGAATAEASDSSSVESESSSSTSPSTGGSGSASP